MKWFTFILFLLYLAFFSWSYYRAGYAQGTLDAWKEADIEINKYKNQDDEEDYEN